MLFQQSSRKCLVKFFNYAIPLATVKNPLFPKSFLLKVKPRSFSFSSLEKVAEILLTPLSDMSLSQINNFREY